MGRDHWTQAERDAFDAICADDAIAPTLESVPRIEQHTFTLEDLAILQDHKWDAELFIRILAVRHRLISMSDSPGYERWCAHQNLNRSAHQARAEAASLEMVLGFFRPGTAREVSLFSGYPEIVDRHFVEVAAGPGGRLGALIIGEGCADLAVPVQLRYCPLPDGQSEDLLDPAVSRDWGWTDGYGSHIERYDAASRTYMRRSMTGRTDYDLLIEQDGRVRPLW